MRLIGASAAIALIALALSSCRGTAASSTSPQTEEQAAAEKACNAWLDASNAVAVARLQRAVPDDQRPRFVQNCVLLMNAPGQSGATDALSQCASALAAADPRTSVACPAPPGTLPNGASCGSEIQCATGFCRGGFYPSDGLPWRRSQCGVCTARIPLGQPCVPAGMGIYSDLCETGATCAFQSYVNDAPTGKCVAISAMPPTRTGPAGAKCNSVIDCMSGLACVSAGNPMNYAAGVCGPPVKSGGRCVWSPDCEQPLVCALTGDGGGYICQPRGGEGDQCMTYVDFTTSVTGTCSVDMACVPGGCTPFTYAPPGEACSDAVPCAKNMCLKGVCPDVIADGASCAGIPNAQSCDVFAHCHDDVCGFFDPASCQSGDGGANDGAPAKTPTLTFPGETYRAISGAADDDIWIVGDSAPRHWDGTNWVSMPAGPSLFAVWAAKGDAWGLGSSLAVQHWDGTAWRTIDTSSIATAGGTSLASIWAAGPNDVWVVGFGMPSGMMTGPGLIAHFDGTTWTRFPVDAIDGFLSVWGSSSKNVWAGGGNGVMYHWDGAAWSKADSATMLYRYGLWGSSASDVWSVGNFGTVTRYDGKAWSKVIDEGYAQYVSISGASSANVWAVGSFFVANGSGSGRLLGHWNGTTWSRCETFDTKPLSSVWVSPSGKVWVVDGGVLEISTLSDWSCNANSGP